VPYKGKLSSFVFQLTGGVRAGMGYCGAKTIPDFWDVARFVRVTAAGHRESHPHDVKITKESPNYFQE
jgi:IMP dehydrogenase